MSGAGTDYTLTATLGLYKPIANMAVGLWGDLSIPTPTPSMLPFTSHPAVAHYLPLAGSATVFGPTTFSGTTTFTGPLTYTATGGSVARSAQDRANDVCNVIDFGADPTGVADSAPAINSAAALGKAVYLPAGTYHIRSRISLAGGQTMYGDGRGLTTITVSDDFNPMETTCVISLSATQTIGGEPGPVVRDLCIAFAQPTDAASRSSFTTIASGGTSHLGGTGVQYPWAIAALARCRPIVSHVRISGAWDGITTNGNNAAFWLDDIEIGALDVGISLAEGASGVYDWCHINGYHFWAYGLSAGPILTGVFMDGQTVAMRVGAQNGLEARGVVSYQGRIIFTSAASNCWADMVNVNLDNWGATLEIATCRFMHITNFYAVSNNPLREPVTIGGGIVGFSNWYSENTNTKHLSVTGGDVTVTGAYFLMNSTVDGAARVSGGRLRMSTVRLNPAATGAWASPLIVQTGTGVLQVSGLDVTGTTGSSGVSVSFGTDVSGNYLGSFSDDANWQPAWQLGANGHYGAVIVAPNDKTSMQTGSNSFVTLAASAHDSTAYGYLSLGQAGTGTQNTAFGALAGYGVVNGSHNTLVGTTAGYAPTSTGYSNTTCIGAQTGLALTTGANNTLIGYQAGIALTVGGNNLYICAGDGRVGSGATATEANTLRLSSALRATGINTNTPSLFMDWLPGSTSYANDAAAATGGVAVGQLYRNGSVIQFRAT